MADEIKEVSVHNGSIRSFITSKGELKPGKSQTLDAVEAKKLLVYRGVKDAASIVNSEEVTVENAKIRKQIEDLTVQMKAVLEEKAQLLEAVIKLDVESKDLKNQVKGLQKLAKKADTQGKADSQDQADTQDNK